MKNGIQSNKLLLVDGRGHAIGGETWDELAADYACDSDMVSAALESSRNIRSALVVLMSVSIVCTATAIASGSYAIWLSRRQAASQTLTDVNDLLKTCQTRMRQLETEVQQLPGRAL